MKENVIWTNMIDYEEWMDNFFNEEYPPEEYTEEQRMDIIDSEVYMNLGDERVNLSSCVCDDEIIVIGDIGRWDGRFTGYKIIRSGRLSDCLSSEADYVKWYCDPYNFRCTEHHHDGTNYLLYRTWKPNISDRQKENFLNKIYKNREVTPQCLSRYTQSLRPMIAKVYGW